MEIPGKVSIYCPLIEAKGTSGMLLSIQPPGYYQVEISVKGRRHTFFLPVAETALFFSDPEPEREEEFEIER